MYLDKKGLIVQSDGDAGDCLQREGFWFEGVYINSVNLGKNYPVSIGMAPYMDAIEILLTPEGLVRSWMPGNSIPPWNTPSDTSRDQLVSNIRACGYYELDGITKQIFKNVLKNYSRFPNKDIAFINDYGRFIRSFRTWYLYPLLLICDVPLIVNSIIRIIKGKLDPDNVGDDINHIGDLAQAQHVYPTPISWFARKIYRRGEYALNWYFRPSAKGNIEFAELWAPIVKGF